MDINTLDQHLKLTDGVLQLTSDKMSNAVFSELLKLYYGNTYVEIKEATKEVTETSIVVTGQSNFLEVADISTKASFSVDDQGTPQCLITYQMIGEHLEANPWVFSRSFKDLPKFGFESLGNSLLLDQLTLTDAKLMLTTQAQKAPKTNLPLKSGLNFTSKLNPKGVLGLFGTLFNEGHELILWGQIEKQLVEKHISPLPYQTYPWQMENKAPGIYLQADLGIEIDLNVFKFSKTQLQIYTPLTQAWLQKNISYQPLIAVAGTFDLPDAQINGEMIAEINLDNQVLDLIALTEGISIDNLASLSGFSNGSDFSSFLPQVIQAQLSTLGKLSLERLGFTLSGGFTGSSVELASFALGFPGVKWDIAGLMPISDFKTEFMILTPFESSSSISTSISASFGYIGQYFSLISGYPDFWIRAELEEGSSFSLKDLFKTTPALPPPPEIVIDQMVIGAQPNSSDYAMYLNVADDPSWSIDLGPEPLIVNGGYIELLKSGESTTATLSGNIAIGDLVDFEMSYTLPGTFMARADLPSFELESFVKTLSTLSSSIWEALKINITLDQSYLLIEEKEGVYSLTCATLLKDFGLFMVTIQKTIAWGFGFGMEISSEGLNKLVDTSFLVFLEYFMCLDDFMMVLSSVNVPEFNFPATADFNAPALGKGNLTLPSQANGLVEGLNIYCKLSSVNNDGLKLLMKFVGLDLTAKLDMAVSVSLPDPSTFTKAFFSFKFDNPPYYFAGNAGAAVVNKEPLLYLAAQLKLSVQGKPLSFDTSIALVPNGIFISGNVTGTLSFGPVQLSNFGLVLGINREAIPSFGLMTTIDISQSNASFNSSVALFFDSTDPSKSMFAAAISDLTLAAVASTLAGQAKLPSPLQEVLGAVGLKGLNAFSISGSVASDLNNRDLAKISAAFKSHGNIDLPTENDQVLLVANQKGNVWHLTNLKTMMHYTLTQAQDQIKVDLEAQFYAAPRDTQIGAQTFPQGFKVFAEVDFFILKEKIQVDISPGTGILVDMEASPITIYKKSFFVITSADGKSGPRLSVCSYSRSAQQEPDAQLQPPHFLITGKMSILGLPISSLYASFSLKGVEIDLKEQISVLLSLEIKAQITSLNNMSLEGRLTLGVKQKLDLGILGAIHLDFTIHGALKLSFDGNTAQASLSELKFSFQGVGFEIPDIKLGVDGDDLKNIEKTLTQAATQLVKEFLNVTAQWAEWAAKGLIEGIKTAEQAAKTLKDAGKIAFDVGKALKDAFKQNIGQATKCLKNAGYSAAAVGSALKGTFTDSAGEAAKALKSAGYTAAKAGKALKGTFTNNAEEAAKALKGAGYAAEEIAKVAKDVFNATAKVTAKILKDMGVAAKTANDILNGAGYAASEVKNALKDVFDWIPHVKLPHVKHIKLPHLKI